MKKIIIGLLCVLAVTVSITVHGAALSSDENAASQDSTLSQDSTFVDVIGWFSKNDTVTYCINESAWKITETDTVRTADFSFVMRINVEDSTASGYKMACTFLESPVKTFPDSASAFIVWQNLITDKLSEKVAGTTVHFETDEYGHITKYNNLGKIKKQAKSLVKEVLKEFEQLPDIQGLKKMGFDLKGFEKYVNTDKLVDGYLEELQMLFAFHGRSVRKGKHTIHEDASDDTFENNTLCSAFVDDEDQSYCIVYDETSILPHESIKEVLGGVVESISNDSLTEFYNKDWGSSIKFNGTYEDFMQLNYLYNGWPYSVIRQKTTMIGPRGKAKQTVISLDFCSIAR